MKIAGDIVVGLDGSESSRKAAQFAVDHFSADAPIDLVTVINTAAPEGSYAQELLGSYSDADSPEALARGEKIIETARQALVLPEGEQVRITSRVLFGDPAEELDKCGMDAGLLIIGHHGSDRAPAGRIGTVSRGLPGHALSSVLIHRPDDDAELAAGPSARPVIVGMDTSEYSAVAALDAADFAQRAGAPLQIVVATGPLGDSDRAHAQTELDLTWLRAEFRDLQVTARFEDGNPVEALARVSQEAQLTCIGKRGLNLFHGMAVQLGRAAAGLIDEARSSLLLSAFRDDPRMGSRRIVN